MKYDIILCGVGGQGVLSVAALIGRAAAAEGLQVKQSEVHGMSQRGGAVMAHLRFADHPVASDLIPQAGADLILSMEPMESLRYVGYLAAEAALVTATEPFKNIPDYPELDTVLAAIRRLPHSLLVDAAKLADEAGNPVAVNTVMVGAASRLLPFRADTLEKVVREMFSAKGVKVVEMNLKALELGRRAYAASSHTCTA
ncbi:MAG: indolepyruvate oxidoreductase subunit beta [Candidatus Eisenbacteria bacterium]|nr:indolepyruvate oxidoreductase subunit beta [Candidatus Eisenbacteria bacterium]